ncbi:MAG: phytoene desaturase [Flavobacteriales bacterium]|jgi:phytoene desaturase
MSNTATAIVVGSGLGGLSSAIRLRALGYDVEIVEANEQAGGRASVFLKDGFSFDAGPTVVTAPYLVDELYELVGRRREEHIQFMPVDPFYRVKYADGTHFDYVGDEDRIIAQIEEMNPRDVDGYRRLAKHAEAIFDIGYTQLAHVPFETVGDMLRVAPDMIRLKNYRSVYGLVSSYIEDERLRQAFSFQPLLVGGNPFKTSSIYLLIHWLERKWGVHFAKGGTAAIVAGLVRLFEEIGGRVRLNSPVEQIVVENGTATGVILEGGTQLNADIVVCNADPSTVYTKMIDPKWRRKHTDRSVNRKRQSMSLFVTYFGTKKKYPDLAHHSIILSKRYKELLWDIFEHKTLSDDFSLYLHAPTRSDESVAPEGHEGFYVLSPVPNQLSGIDWEKKHAEYEKRIIDFLDETHLPGLKENLVTCFSVDPRYFEGRLRSHHGNAFGIEPVLQQSAYFRYHNRSEDVASLFFVGAGCHPGAGMPGVIASAKVLEAVVPRLHESEKMPIPSKPRIVRSVA